MGGDRQLFSYCIVVCNELSPSDIHNVLQYLIGLGNWICFYRIYFVTLTISVTCSIIEDIVFRWFIYVSFEKKVCFLINKIYEDNNMNQTAIFILNEIFTIELSADVYNIKPVIFYYFMYWKAVLLPMSVVTLQALWTNIWNGHYFL